MKCICSAGLGKLIKTLVGVNKGASWSIGVSKARPGAAAGMFWGSAGWFLRVCKAFLFRLYQQNDASCRCPHHNCVFTRSIFQIFWKLRLDEYCAENKALVRAVSKTSVTPSCMGSLVGKLPPTALRTYLK